MKFKIIREVFLEGIQIVQTGIGSQRENLILENILLESKGDRLFLTTTDLEIEIKTEVDIKNGVDGSITIAAKRLNEIIRQIDQDEVNLEVDKKNKVTIWTPNKKSIFSLFGLPADNFPEFPALLEGEGLSLSASLLNEMIKKVIFAVAVNDTRVVLCGVCILFKKGEIIIRATNGHRLALIKRELENILNENEYIIPTKILKQIPHIFKDNKIDLIITPTQVSLQDKKTVVYSKLITGKFPDYNKWLKSIEGAKEIRLNRREFLDAARRADIMTSERNNIIKIYLEKDTLFISARSPDIGEAKESINISYKGDNIEMGFNPKYLLEALANIEDEEILFCFSGVDKPVLLETIDKRQINLIMPIKI